MTVSKVSIGNVEKISKIIDEVLFSKLFVLLWVQSFSKSWFVNKHSIISKIPFVSGFFGWVIAGAITLVVILASIIEPFVRVIVNFASIFKTKKQESDFWFKSHYFILLSVIFVFLIWVVF